MKKQNIMMAALLVAMVANPDHSPVTIPLQEVFHLE